MVPFQQAQLVGREQVCTTLEAFLARKPPIVVECASRQCLVEMGVAVLAAGIDLLPLSLTAFADPGFTRLPVVDLNDVEAVGNQVWACAEPFDPVLARLEDRPAEVP